MPSNLNIVIAFFMQVVATIIVTLWHLNDGACVSISSTILYSLEKGTEGIKMSLDEATLVRKFTQHSLILVLQKLFI